MTENRFERSLPRGTGPMIRIACCVLITVLGVILPGCRWNLNFPGNPFVSTPPCTLPPNLTKPQLVSYLNRNILALHSWRSTDVRITTSGPGGIPINLHAEVAVQSPRNFRLIASSIGGNEADLGSNSERFWFWMRRNKARHVFTASHTQIEQTQQRLMIPFRPDWLMEVLGVVPLDDQQFEMQQTTDPNRVKLISERLSPSGRLVRRVIVVDICYGHILSHNLQNENGTILARAGLDDYRIDPVTGLSVPYRINLRWPRAGLKLTMRLGTVALNPGTMPEQTWQLPTIPGYSLFDLGRLPSAARRTAGGQPRPRPLGTRFQQAARDRPSPRSPVPASAVEETPRWEPSPTVTRSPVRFQVENPFAPQTSQHRPATARTTEVENPFAPQPKPSRTPRTPRTHRADAWWK